MQTKKIVIVSSLFAMGLVSLISACTFSHTNDPVQIEAQKTEVQSSDAAATKAPVAKPVLAKGTEKVPAKAPEKTPVKSVIHSAKDTPTKAPAKTAIVAAPTEAKAAVATDEKLIRYVAADLLNVHSSPRMDAPVTAKIKKGSMFTILTINDEWAKVGEGQYVMSRYLSRKQASGYKVVMGR
jgi:hypothetical protein